MGKATLRLFFIFAVTLILACAKVQAQESFAPYERDFIAARQLVLDGHVREGISQIEALLGKLDPAKEPYNYWFVGMVLADFLSQIASYEDEAKVLNQVASTKLHSSNPILFQQLASKVGRNLAFTGHSNEGEKVLRNLTGGDARWVITPPQRDAARVLSRIELDRENVGQAAIWMRRAVIGTLVDKGASSEEVVDTLTDYAIYLRRTRQIGEAHDLLTKLIPVYDQTFPHRGPKYLNFASELLESARSIGNFETADNIYRLLKQTTAEVDIIAPSVRAQMFYQDIYSAAAKSTEAGNPELSDRLKKLATEFPNWIKLPDSRIAFSYFSLLAGDIEQAEKFAASPSDKQESIRIAAYDQIIKAHIAARREDYIASSQMLSEALLKISAYHHEFSSESPSKLPTLSLEERLVLSATLSRIASHVSSPQQADLVFRLEQFLNRDKAKLSLSARVARLSATSDLQREDLRTRDRLKDLRERIMFESAQQLLSRTLPIKGYEPSKSNDYAFLIRLEQIEGKISTVDESIKRSGAATYVASEDTLSLEKARALLKPGEALVGHVLLPGHGLFISCVSAESQEFEVAKFTPSELKQLLIDEKLLSAALRSINEPSRELDSLFPAESSFRLYRATLGPIESCLDRKRSILLATDADLFSTPWNALLTELDTSKPFRHRSAAWTMRSFSISLLPSVMSLDQLRRQMPATEATEKFLGIGDPDFTGRPDPSKQLALAPLIGIRGAGSRSAIRQLPRLPEAGTELRSEATVLGVKSADLLLGTHASERQLRSRPLEKYKIVSFATHALVAGEADGVTEPALVLSPGEEEDNPKNDGILTTNEIADLALDANLIILSACNTAAPDGRLNSRGLSGLADAFFFAGARSLAVTQWAVYSAAAEQIGSGLVSLAEREPTLGVADALRQTTLNFVSTAREDYMAHPRFWAAFIIAGDGSIAPLSGSSGRVGRIRIDKEIVLENRDQSELLGITETSSKANYATGMARPLAGENRAGSYILRFTSPENSTVIDLDRRMATSSRIFDLGDYIGVSGYYPSSCQTCLAKPGQPAAVFKLLGRDGELKWQVVRESSNSSSNRFGTDIVEFSDTYILVSLETDYASVSESATTLWLTAVSREGKFLRERHVTLPLILPALAKGTTINAFGDLVLAVGGEYPASEKHVTPMQTNPLTGTRTYTCASMSTSFVFRFDPLTFSVRQQFEIKDGLITRLRDSERTLFGLMDVSADCRLTSGVRVVEIDLPGQAVKSIFQTQTTNSIQSHDFVVTQDRIVIVGRVYVFLPPILVRPTMSSEELANFSKKDFLKDSAFDNADSDSVMNAAILVIRRDGVLVGDKVIHDALNRSLAAVAIRGDHRYVAAGSALGTNGWLVEFSDSAR
ncbi:CHAT domain-containing protein [Bradyrhizobium sp. ma5]|uniref:CHAT domain-containing protein n=1 Tax=Bradyrhizobium sp. ma5 TaxID=3344828 RepID=UPI0035D48D06